MDAATRARLSAIMAKSKRGVSNTDEEYDFVYECRKKWPKEYAALSGTVVTEVNREVNPFN